MIDYAGRDSAVTVSNCVIRLFIIVQMQWYPSKGRGSGCLVVIKGSMIFLCVGVRRCCLKLKFIGKLRGFMPHNFYVTAV